MTDRLTIDVLVADHAAPRVVEKLRGMEMMTIEGSIRGTWGRTWCEKRAGAFAPLPLRRLPTSWATHTSRPAEISFIQLIIDHLTANGVMDAAHLYEAPFTAHAPTGPDRLLAPSEVESSIVLLDDVRASAHPRDQTANTAWVQQDADRCHGWVSTRARWIWIQRETVAAVSSGTLRAAR